MAAKTLTDPFHYCWSALLDECNTFSGAFFTKNDCFIEDTRDADFEKIENRLSYMYKFGHINVLLVEKCALTFFDQYFKGDKNYFSGNIKICSLSNGPGIDIVGFLRALYKSNKLKCSPLLQAINLHDSWKTVYLNLIHSAYHEYNSNFNEIHTVIPPENIQFIQCDIFSSLSLEVQNLIGSCDILLMVKVLISTKAASKILTETMQKIFSLLQPGSLVFFFGNKSNIKNITTKDCAKKFVKCLFGPIEMDLQKLAIDENVFKISNLKIYLTRKVHFIVLQRKAVAEETVVDFSQDTTKRKKKLRKRKRNNSTVLPPNSNEISLNVITLSDSEEENDTDSESSHTSSSIQSDTLSIHFQHSSHENKLGFSNMASQSLNDADCADEKKQSLNLPEESTSLSENTLPFEKINTEPVSNMARVDTVIKESLTGEFTLTDSPELDKLASHEGIADKSVSTDSKQSSQLGGRGKVQSPNGDVSVMDLTSENNLERTKAILSKQILPSVSLHHADLFQPPKMAACKEIGMQDASNDRNKLADISRNKGCPSQMNCSTYNGAERGVETVNAEKQPKIASHIQFQPDSNTAVSGHSVDVKSSDDLHTMLQRCENVIASLEREIALISTDLQSLQNNEVPMEECCSRYICSAFRNWHCCMHCDKFSVQSCSRKKCCTRTHSNVCVAHSNCVCWTECMNDTRARLCHSDVSTKPYFVIPVQNEDLLQILSFISEKC